MFPRGKNRVGLERHRLPFLSQWQKLASLRHCTRDAGYPIERRCDSFFLLYKGGGLVFLRNLDREWVRRAAAARPQRLRDVYVCVI